MIRKNNIKYVFPLLVLLFVGSLVGGCSSNSSHDKSLEKNRVLKDEFITTQIVVINNDFLSPESINEKASRVMGIFQTIIEKLTQLLSRSQLIPKFTNLK